jgi:hypothetical protein
MKWIILPCVHASTKAAGCAEFHGMFDCKSIAIPKLEGKSSGWLIVLGSFHTSAQQVSVVTDS